MVLAAVFVSAELSRTILTTYRSEPRFESPARGTIRKTLKNYEHFEIFY